MTFKVLIIEDNHSFIDTLKVMLRDLPLDFSHAYRYNDALAILEKHGIFYNRQETAAEITEANEAPVKKKDAAAQAPLYNDHGIFLIIVEQNTETSMKGTDFVAHAIRKHPGLSESDFILLTHRLDAVPTRNYGFPVFEKPLRAPQIRQAVLQKIRQAQEITEAQARTANTPTKPAESSEAEARVPRKSLRDLLKINRNAPHPKKTGDAKEKPARKTRSTGPAAKKASATKKASPK
jgi:CheY-like chemotaxis protein